MQSLSMTDETIGEKIRHVHIKYKALVIYLVNF